VDPWAVAYTTSTATAQPTSVAFNSMSTAFSACDTGQFCFAASACC
jgi:hypothetical protein